MKEEKITIGKQTVKVKKLKPKQKKKESYAVRDTNISCPNCLSSMKLDDIGNWQCTGDKIQIWEPEFVKYNQMSQDNKNKYLRDLSNYSRFMELFDRWKFAHDSSGEEIFNCGYTNLIFPLTASSQIKIPDPLFTKILEQKLGRPLTEEELYGESELYFYQGQVLTSYRNNAKLIRVPFVILPSEETIYEPLEKKNEKNSN